MHIGSTLNIHRREADGTPGELLGQAQMIHPRAAQALPPFDLALGTTPHRADELIAVEGNETYWIFRIRPGLVSLAEAQQIVQDECPGLELVETPNGLVTFEFNDQIADDDFNCEGAPWYCKIICLQSCSSC